MLFTVIYALKINFDKSELILIRGAFKFLGLDFVLSYWYICLFVFFDK